MRIERSSFTAERGSLRQSHPWVILVIALAVFGPYIGGGIRTEQVAVYGLLILNMPRILREFRLGLGGRFIVPWFAYVATAIVSTLLPIAGAPIYPEGNVLAGLENVLSPLAVMLIVWGLVSVTDAISTLIALSRVLSIAMAINGLLAFVSTRIDLSPLLRYFWTQGSPPGESVAELAATMGRYSGLFNQPAEAGMLYSIAALGAVYGWHGKPKTQAVTLVAITIGGLLSVSKVFLMGGLPLAVAYFLLSANLARILILAVASGTLVFVGSTLGIFSDWDGFDYLVRLLSPPESSSLISFYSAGRFGGETFAKSVLADVMEVAPVAGIGLGGWRVPYDNFAVEAAVTAGVVGIVLMTWILVALIALPRRIEDRRTSDFAMAFALMVAAGSIGFNPLTANRVSIVTWLVTGLLVLAADPTAESRSGFRKKRSALTLNQTLQS